MANYSGIYLLFEGTTAECSSTQLPRESVFDTDSGLFRYMDAASGIHYMLASGESFWQDIGGASGIYYPVTGFDCRRVILGDPVSDRLILELDRSIPSAAIGSSAMLSLCGSSVKIVSDTGGGADNGDLMLSLSGDAYTDTWSDYTPVVSGWSDYSNSKFKYKTLGKLAFVSFSITGTGDEYFTQFYLPHAPDSECGWAVNVVAGERGADHVSYAGAAAHVVSGSSGIIVDISGNFADSYGSIFGSGVSKWVCGQIFYQRA